MRAAPVAALRLVCDPATLHDYYVSRLITSSNPPAAGSISMRPAGRLDSAGVVAAGEAALGGGVSDGDCAMMEVSS